METDEFPYCKTGPFEQAACYIKRENDYMIHTFRKDNILPYRKRIIIMRKDLSQNEPHECIGINVPAVLSLSVFCH